MTQHSGHSTELGALGEDPGEIEMIDPSEPAPLSFGESASFAPGS